MKHGAQQPLGATTTTETTGKRNLTDNDTSPDGVRLMVSGVSGLSGAGSTEDGAGGHDPATLSIGALALYQPRALDDKRECCPGQLRVVGRHTTWNQ